MGKIVVANWKMNPANLLEAKSIANRSGKTIPRGIELIICPPSLFFIPLTANLKGKKYKLGLQNVFYEEFFALRPQGS